MIFSHEFNFLSFYFSDSEFVDSLLLLLSSFFKLNVHAKLCSVLISSFKNFENLLPLLGIFLGLFFKSINSASLSSEFSFSLYLLDFLLEFSDELESYE